MIAVTAFAVCVVVDVVIDVIVVVVVAVVVLIVAVIVVCRDVFVVVDLNTLDEIDRKM